MPRDPRITAYIARARPFAKPILRHLRTIVHDACPGAEERMKWSFPHFDYKGTMMCSMAAFTSHAVFGFWYASRMKDPRNVMERRGNNTAMGNFGRITSLADLPSAQILKAYVREAARLNEGPTGTGAGRKGKGTVVRTKAPRTPPDLRIALQKNERALKIYSAFPPGHRKEYVEWITDARTSDTRARRIRTAIEWMSEGKPRNWKYMKRSG